MLTCTIYVLLAADHRDLDARYLAWQSDTMAAAVAEVTDSLSHVGMQVLDVMITPSRDIDQHRVLGSYRVAMASIGYEVSP